MAELSSLQEVYALLKEFGGLIVHFVAVPPMGLPGRPLYPENIRWVAKHADAYRLSCSIALPGDRFHWKGQQSNFPGCIGLILAPTACGSIVSVRAEDNGTPSDSADDAGLDSVVTLEKLRQSIVGRTTGYNEWAVRGSRVLGLFLAPGDVIVTHHSTGISVENGGYEFPTISREEIFAEFPDYSIYSFDPLQNIVKVSLIRPDDVINHTDLYCCDFTRVKN